jgi:hypothetical protein
MRIFISDILNDTNQVLFFKCPGNPKDPSNTCQRPLIESIGLNCPIHISNQFIDSNLTNISDELMQSDTEDEFVILKDQGIPEIEAMNQHEEQNSRVELDAMISNVRLISIIKEEKLDQEDLVI